MKHFLVLAVTALVLAATAPSAFAVKMRVIDPPPEPNQEMGCEQYQACPIRAFGDQVTAPFMMGRTEQDPGPTWQTWYLWLENATGSPINEVIFHLTVPEGAGGQSVDECDSNSPNGRVLCPETLPGDGDPFTISFFPGPSIPAGNLFWLYTDFDPAIQPNDAGVIASIPEPGTLGLFGLGVLLLLVGMGRRDRKAGKPVFPA